MPSFSCISLELFDKVGDFIENQLFFQQLLLLAVESFFNDADFGIKRLLIWVFSFQFSPTLFVLRVLELLGKVILLDMNILNLFLEVQHFLSQLRNLNQSLLRNLHLPLILSDLDPNHPDLILHIFYVHLRGPQDILLYV